MRVWEAMSTVVTKVLKGSKVTRAREALRKSGSRIVVVVEDYATAKYVGFLTRTDVIKITSSRSEVLVDELLREGPVLTAEDGIWDAINTLRNSGVYTLPVLKSKHSKSVVGTLGYRELIRSLKVSGYLPKAQAAADVMTIENLPLIAQDEPITKAWSMLVYRGIKALVVVRSKRDLTPVGMLTPKDLVDTGRWYFRREAEAIQTPVAKVRTIMKRGVIVAYPDTPIDAIADYIIKHDFTLVPVINEDGYIIGVVTQEDVLRAYIEGIKPGRIPVPVAPPPLPVTAAEVPVFESRATLLQKVMVREVVARPVGLKAIDVASPEIPAVRVNDTIEHARRVMLRERTSIVLVVDEKGRVVGSLSTRNLLYSIGVKGPLWRRRPYDAEFIREVMNPNVAIVRSSTPIEEIASLMVTEDAEVALVVDEKGELKGIVTKEELIRALAETRGGLRVKNIAAPPGLGVVHPHHSLAHAVRKMRAYYLDALAVAVGGEAQGVVSENRLPFVPLEDARRGLRSRRLIWVRKLVKAGRPLGRYVKITPLLVEDVMTRVPVCVTFEDKVSSVFEHMLEYNVDGLPVIDSEGRVVGVVCKYDMVRELARAARKVEKVEVSEVKLSEPGD